MTVCQNAFGLITRTDGLATSVVAGSCSSRRIIGHCRRPRYLLQKQDLQVPWCHLAPAEGFHQTANSTESGHSGAGFSTSQACQIRLSSAGDQCDWQLQNPELVAQALADRDLLSLPLLLCGIAAEQRAQGWRCIFLTCEGMAAGFSDPELALAYHKALAVVIPSRVEGFGLPAIEVMASGGLSLVAMFVACGRLELRRPLGFLRASLSSSVNY